MYMFVCIKHYEKVAKYKESILQNFLSQIKLLKVFPIRNVKVCVYQALRKNDKVPETENLKISKSNKRYKRYSHKKSTGLCVFYSFKK